MNLFLKSSTFYILLISTVIMAVLMSLQGSSLKTPETRGGIVSLELAPSQIDADSVLDTWNEYSTPSKDIIQIAILNTKIDFGFLLCYSLFLFTCALQLAAKFNDNKILKLFAWSALVAGILDILENIGMLQTLHLKGSDTIAWMTAVAAYFKFALLIGAVLAILVFVIKFLVRKIIKLR